MDIDDGAILPAREVAGALQFSVSCGGNDGRMIQILSLGAPDAVARENGGVGIGGAVADMAVCPARPLR